MSIHAVHAVAATARMFYFDRNAHIPCYPPSSSSSPIRPNPLGIGSSALDNPPMTISIDLTASAARDDDDDDAIPRIVGARAEDLAPAAVSPDRIGLEFNNCCRKDPPRLQLLRMAGAPLCTATLYIVVAAAAAVSTGL